MFGVSAFLKLEKFKTFPVLVFQAVFWCFGVSDFEKFSNSSFWGCVFVFRCFRLSKIFESSFLGLCFWVLAFGSVFWCFGISDFEKFSSPHF